MFLSELQSKNIVNTTDGKNIGNIMDVKIDKETGKIEGFIIEPQSMFSFMSRSKEAEIIWESIVMIGEDVILVKL